MRFEQYQFPGRRSNVLAINGLVATSQPLAAQAGLDILKAGGNAVDAAVATVAALCVVEPTSTGIGGDAFALIWSATEGKLYGLNASGPAPAGLSAGHLRAQGHETMPARGALTVTVPGSLRGWESALARFGSMGLDRLLARAIDYAGNGYPVSQRIGLAWRRSEGLLDAHPDSRRVWLPGGRAPRPGETFRNPEIAATLATLADEGYESFYQGDIGRQIVATVREAGGVLAMEDLAAYRAEWVEPMALDYRDGYTFYEIPPNGQGLTALIALNIAQSFDLAGLGRDNPEAWHAQIEATKLAFADAAAYIGDPRHVAVPVAGLLSHDYALTRRAEISAQRALMPVPGQPSRGSDTVYLTVADGQGNMVSWIQSLYMGFGSGLTAGRTGVQLQNRGANFVLDEGHPNQVAPGKRPYHTIIPGFISRQGQAWSSFGVMGGFMQPQGHLQVGVNLVDYSMDPQAALDAPRFRWLEGRRIALEPATPEPVRRALARWGHELVEPETAARLHFGGGQVIVRDPDSGVLIGGSEPRNDGAAAGW